MLPSEPVDVLLREFVHVVSLPAKYPYLNKGSLALWVTSTLEALELAGCSPLRWGWTPVHAGAFFFPVPVDRTGNLSYSSYQKGSPPEGRPEPERQRQRWKRWG